MIDQKTGWYFMATSIKGVLVDDGRRVLLGRNPRDEWELPGGWPDREDDGPERTVLREIAEETGLAAEVAEIVDCSQIDVGDEGQVLIVAYLCRTQSFDALTSSGEHKYFKAFDADELEREVLHPAYRRAITRALARLETHER